MKIIYTPCSQQLLQQILILGLNRSLRYEKSNFVWWIFIHFHVQEDEASAMIQSLASHLKWLLDLGLPMARRCSKNKLLSTQVGGFQLLSN